jgi:two-component system chemotaxis response regulator CheB
MAQNRSDTAESIIARDIKKQQQGTRSGEPSVYTCPDCGGVLWQVDEEDRLKFSCHTGHDFTADGLVVAMSRALEQAVVEAVRALKEKSLLIRQLAAAANPRSETTMRLIEQAEQDEENARLLRSHLLEDDQAGPSMDTTNDVLSDMVRDLRRRADD